ncbi:hypothetical protein V9S08_003998 [Escherichia coli]
MTALDGLFWSGLVWSGLVWSGLVVSVLRKIFCVVTGKSSSQGSSVS